VTAPGTEVRGGGGRHHGPERANERVDSNARCGGELSSTRRGESRWIGQLGTSTKGSFRLCRGNWRWLDDGVISGAAIPGCVYMLAYSILYGDMGHSAFYLAAIVARRR
jgi:hypothetical protein